MTIRRDGFTGAVRCRLVSLKTLFQGRITYADETLGFQLGDADSALDACWTALHDWLTGFAKLPDKHAESQEARALLAELYPDGLGFILLPYELEWGQSDLRLGRIAGESLGERLRRLGGGVFIEALQTAHWECAGSAHLPTLPGVRAGRPTHQ